MGNFPLLNGYGYAESGSKCPNAECLQPGMIMAPNMESLCEIKSESQGGCRA